MPCCALGICKRFTPIRKEKILRNRYWEHGAMLKSIHRRFEKQSVSWHRQWRIDKTWRSKASVQKWCGDAHSIGHMGSFIESGSFDTFAGRDASWRKCVQQNEARDLGTLKNIENDCLNVSIVKYFEQFRVDWESQARNLKISLRDIFRRHFNNIVTENFLHSLSCLPRDS